MTNSVLDLHSKQLVTTEIKSNVLALLVITERLLHNHINSDRKLFALVV
jgi:hypothetical protein